MLSRLSTWHIFPGVPIAEAATSNTQVEIELDLPSYDEIHLYKTVERNDYIAIEPVNFSSNKASKTKVVR